jgi:hypothetical protein
VVAAGSRSKEEGDHPWDYEIITGIKIISKRPIASRPA